MERLEMLAEYYPVDQVLEDNDVSPLVVYKFLVREGLIDIDQYFLDEEEEEDS